MENWTTYKCKELCTRRVIKLYYHDISLTLDTAQMHLTHVHTTFTYSYEFIKKDFEILRKEPLLMKSLQVLASRR